ncbi:MAG: Spy/CpxP family protein refolding chaperone [Candidatus Marinarcus sp.]|uniref:Spy/CpxP family protein refolding chaperone n=1 Tax=Candidatus Marinarcus sp. TaxID=3100987 RepID=UPI003B00CE84
MTKLKIFVVLCSIFLSLSLFADKYEYNGTHTYKNLDYLNLDKHQYEKIKEILIDYRKAYAKYYKEKQKEEEKLQELMRKEKFDKHEYKDIVEEIYEDAISLEAKTLKKIHAILTQEQRVKFSYYLQEWRVE